MKVTSLPTKTDLELKELARDIVQNLVFTDRQLKNADDYFHVFFILTALDLSAVKNDVGMVYEYYSEAGPRGINGYPFFCSARFLTRVDTRKVLSYVSRLQEQFHAL